MRKPECGRHSDRAQSSISLPKIIRKNKEALSKEDVVDILNACSDIRLKTYVMFLAAPADLEQ